MATGEKKTPQSVENPNSPFLEGSEQNQLTQTVIVVGRKPTELEKAEQKYEDSDTPETRKALFQARLNQDFDISKPKKSVYDFQTSTALRRYQQHMYSQGKMAEAYAASRRIL